MGAKESRPEARLGRGFLLSAAIHAQLLIPLLVATWIYAEREDRQRAEEVDVSFEGADEKELPADLPPLQPREPAERAAARRKKKEEARRVAEAAPPEPEIVVPPLPPPPEEEKPPPPAEPKSNRKAVDLDMGKDVPPPPDAKYLAQKNNRADVETRATETALDKAQEGVQGSSPSPRRDSVVGDDVDKARIAEAEDQKSALGRQAPKATPHARPEAGEENPSGEPRSPLSMRDIPARRHEISPETADPSLPRDADGTFSAPDEQGLRGRRAEAARAPGGKRVKLQISGEDYDYIFGADAEAERRFAQTERSKRPGRLADRLGKVRAALENFIPEVRPGNQTALNTRAAPFAAFIARMHRSIHQLWGFGVLEDWDGKPASSPFNKWDRFTTIEIVLAGDGTVDKVTVVRNSGYLPFDAAAIDVVYSAGPYPDPPREIRSANGKIYIHWQFHRDEQQCATSGAEPYILDNPPPDRDKGEGGSRGPEPGMGAAAEALRVPSRDGGLRRLARVKDDAAHRAKLRELDEAAGDEPERASRQASAQVAHADDPAARAVAQRFFDGYARGDIPSMLKDASFPFRSSGGVAASSAKELAVAFRQMLGEAPGERPLRTLELYSAAGVRGALGQIPRGFGDGAGLLFAVGRAGGDTFVLVLERKQGSWRMVGMVRR